MTSADESAATTGETGKRYQRARAELRDSRVGAGGDFETAAGESAFVHWNKHEHGDPNSPPNSPRLCRKDKREVATEFTTVRPQCLKCAKTFLLAAG